MLQLADHVDSDEEESQEGGGGGFARLSANSMIIAQRWPWTQHVELSTDRRFYHNEIENTFQFHPPKEFSEGSCQSQHHQSHLYHAINYQFIQLMSRSSSHHSPPFSLFQLPSSLPPSQRITAEDIADTDPLSYELEFSQDDYLQYTDLLLALVDSPLLIQNLLSLAEYFVTDSDFGFVLLVERSVPSYLILCGQSLSSPSVVITS
jgi:hypothetical protein